MWWMRIPTPTPTPNLSPAQSTVTATGGMEWAALLSEVLRDIGGETGSSKNHSGLSSSISIYKLINVT